MLTALSTFGCKLRNQLHPNDQRGTRPGQAGLNRKFTIARQIMEISDELRHCSDNELLRTAARLRSQALSGTDLNLLLPNAYGLVREAARRAHNQAHFEVQLVTGICLFDGHIVEMQTGEGKTLAALLPAFLRACVGKGCHVVTANDYLAQRDADFATAVFNRLGISVGCLVESLPREERKEVYSQDITYGTAREFGFDFLKDRLASSTTSPIGFVKQSVSLQAVQRGHYFALVDEADSVMIDDARTPLLIAGQGDDSGLECALIRASSRIALGLRAETDFQLNQDQRSATLTRQGCSTALSRLQTDLLQGCRPDDLYRQIENSLCAIYHFQRDRHYVVTEGKIAIVDESTGRIADGRQWQNGLHQAIEAREALEISARTETMAKITVQSYFRRYRHLAGLTGTAVSVAAEFRQVYKLPVTAVPTRIPSRRIEHSHRIFSGYHEKACAIVLETSLRIHAGQSVLIGTPSVQASYRISGALNEFGIPHRVLNCVEHEREAGVIAEAGWPDRVTVATNMAGRGTDIVIDPSVLERGGLHIIGTEMHSSSRIDRQLMGRTARQGQPGSFAFFLSLEDELLSLAGEQFNLKADDSLPGELSPKWIKVFQRAQRKIENIHKRQRLSLLKQEKNRNKTCLQIGLDPCLELLHDD